MRYGEYFPSFLFRNKMEYFRVVFGAGSEKPRRDVIADIPSFAKKKMVYCVAVHCNNNSSRGTRVSYFGFPTDTKMKKRWVEKIKRKKWKPLIHSKICSDHFDESCFVQDLTLMTAMGLKPGRLLLKADAVPSIFSYSEFEGQQPSKCSKIKKGAYDKRRRREVYK